MDKVDGMDAVDRVDAMAKWMEWTERMRIRHGCKMDAVNEVNTRLTKKAPLSRRLNPC